MTLDSASLGPWLPLLDEAPVALDEERVDLDLLAAWAQDGRVREIFVLLAHAPDLFSAIGRTISFHLNRSHLSAIDREQVILRTAYWCRSRYEVAQHYPIALAAGLSDDDIRSLLGDVSGAAGLIHRAVDELATLKRLSPQLMTELQETMSTEEILEMIFMVSSYWGIALAANSFVVPLDDGCVDLVASFS